MSQGVMEDAEFLTAQSAFVYGLLGGFGEAPPLIVTARHGYAVGNSLIITFANGETYKYRIRSVDTVVIN